MDSVEFDYPMTRKNFFKTVIIHDANTLLDEPYKFGSYFGDIPDGKVLEAIIALQTKFGHDDTMASRVLEARDAFMFAEPYGNVDIVGVYAKDKDVSYSPAPGLKDITRQWQDPETNMLDAMDGDTPGVSGVSARRAWMYSGLGMAGLHAEDSFMKFYNWMPKVAFEGLSPTESCIIGYITSTSIKRWTFLPSTKLSLYDFCTFASTEFPTLSPFGIDALKARVVLLNPDHLPSDYFTLEQKPGQIIHGHHAHSVAGTSILNVAWNYQDYADYEQRVLPNEFALGNFRRKQIFDKVPSLEQLYNMFYRYGVSHHEFILTCELIDHYLYDLPSKVNSQLVRCGKAALTLAHGVARTDPPFIIGGRGKLRAPHTSPPTAHQCDICTAPCPIEIYEFSLTDPISGSKVMPIYTCNPCAFKLMTWEHNPNPTPPLLITFVSDLQLNYNEIT